MRRFMASWDRDALNMLRTAREEGIAEGIEKGVERAIQRLIRSGISADQARWLLGLE
jgi:hypothetical protein